MSTKEELKKTVQEKLAQAYKLLEECEMLAEEGAFEFGFHAPGTHYYPKSIVSEDRVLASLKENEGEDYVADLTPEELVVALRDERELMMEDLPYSYDGRESILGRWMPSRNC